MAWGSSTGQHVSIRLLEHAVFRRISDVTEDLLEHLFETIRREAVELHRDVTGSTKRD